MEINQQTNTRTGMSPEAFRDDIKQHLHYTLAKDHFAATQWDLYQSVVLSVMDRLHDRWIQTQHGYYDRKVKRVYYLSMEYLIGRLLDNMLINLGLKETAARAFEDLGFDYDKLRETEVDAGLGNGGLGRLAACYLDSMATLGIPAIGYGIRYDYGIFEQEIIDGYQVERPDMWLQYGWPWGIKRPEIQYPVQFYGETSAYEDAGGHTRFDWIDTQQVLAQAYDTPIPGYQNDVVNHLRLWGTATSHNFDLKRFNEGEYIEAMRRNINDENITRVLYPNDEGMLGQELRLKQEYFLVSATLQDAFRRFKKQFDDFRKIPQQMAIQCNDTHPHLAIPELMRLLMDREKLSWDTSWEIVTQTVNYTNHTLMPEALEKWPLSLMGNLLPRHVQIIREIDRRFLNTIDINTDSKAEEERKKRMRIIPQKIHASVRMGNLGALGANKINGVSQVHTHLMEKTIFRDFYQEFPEKFVNVTNGITPRRWLLQCNRPLAQLISRKIGDDWIRDLEQLQQLEAYADDPEFIEQFATIKQQKKQELAEYIEDAVGISVHPDSIFDIHIKRLHEYKRQLLSVFHAITLYNRIKENPEADHHPRTIIFAGKAAPGYEMAKLYIKLINAVGHTINNDPEVNDTLKCVFLPDYSVSLAEKMIPAANLSEQISTAGMEASGTGNMKFALNGALTIGTLDGANIEIRERVGAENIFIFGLTVAEIERLREQGYEPNNILDRNEQLQKIIAQLSNGFFTPDEPDLFIPIVNSLINQGDYYMVMADYQPYIEMQQQVEKVYGNEKEWNRRAVMNIAHMGYFSSDRSVREYAKKIWDIEM